MGGGSSKANGDSSKVKGTTSSTTKAEASSSNFTSQSRQRRVIEEEPPPPPIEELTTAEQDRIGKRFDRLSEDSDRPGFLAQQSFVAMPEFIGNRFTPYIFRMFDEDKDGYISREEFTNLIDTMRKPETLDRHVSMIFKAVDSDEDEKVSGDDLITVLRHTLGESVNDLQIKEVVARIIEIHDLDQDEHLNLAEFHELLGSSDVTTVLGYTAR